MQNYLHIGGSIDGLSYPVDDYAETAQWPARITDKDVYHRETLSIGDTSIDIFRHENLTQELVLDRIVAHYKAWAANHPHRRW